MHSRFTLRPWMKRAIWVLLILLLLLVLIIVAGVTFVEIRSHQTLVLPDPTGPYAVGRMEYDWTDQSRYDPLAPHTGMKRELVVWAWYPAMRVPRSRELFHQHHRHKALQLLRLRHLILAPARPGSAGFHRRRARIADYLCVRARFLRHYLNKTPSPLLQGENRTFPEVQFSPP